MTLKNPHTKLFFVFFILLALTVINVRADEVSSPNDKSRATLSDPVPFPQSHRSNEISADRQSLKEAIDNLPNNSFGEEFGESRESECQRQNQSKVKTVAWALASMISGVFTLDELGETARDLDPEKVKALASLKQAIKDAMEYDKLYSHFEELGMTEGVEAGETKNY